MPSSTEIPRLHQSIAKILIAHCPHVAKKAYDEGVKVTKAMDRGSLVDQLLFGGAQYEVIAPRLKSGERKGEVATDWKGAEAKAMKAEIEAREGRWLAVLANELESARALAGQARAKLLERGLDISQAKCMRQHTMQWDSIVPCEGTPDTIVLMEKSGRVDTIDAKLTDANPDRLFPHIYEQGWHIQGAAYQEACNTLREGYRANFGRHWLLAIDEPHDCVSLVPMSQAYMEIGRHEWALAQKIWFRCWDTGQWPAYHEGEAVPPRWVTNKVYGGES